MIVLDVDSRRLQRAIDRLLDSLGDGRAGESVTVES